MPRRRPGHRRALAPAVLVGGAVACGGDPAAGAGDTGRLHTCDGVDASAAYVMRTLTFAPAPDGVGLGFDLDDHATVAGDAEGCGKADITDPDGAPGIDSAFEAHLLFQKQQVLLCRINDFRFNDWKGMQLDVDIVNGRLLQNRQGDTSRRNLQMLLGLRGYCIVHSRRGWWSLWQIHAICSKLTV